MLLPSLIETLISGTYHILYIVLLFNYILLLTDNSHPGHFQFFGGGRCLRGNCPGWELSRGGIMSWGSCAERGLSWLQFARYSVTNLLSNILCSFLCSWKMSAKAIREAAGKDLLRKFVKSKKLAETPCAVINEETKWSELTEKHPWLLTQVCGTLYEVYRYLFYWYSRTYRDFSVSLEHCHVWQMYSIMYDSDGWEVWFWRLRRWSC